MASFGAAFPTLFTPLDLPTQPLEYDRDNQSILEALKEFLFSTSEKQINAKVTKNLSSWQTAGKLRNMLISFIDLHSQNSMEDRKVVFNSLKKVEVGEYWGIW